MLSWCACCLLQKNKSRNAGDRAGPAAAQVHWLNGGCWTAEQDGSCATAADTLAAVLHQASNEEQCPACDAVNDWASRSYCPYHHGALEGYEKAFGDLSQVAIAFQVDPGLIGTVLEARSQQRVHEFELLQRADQQQPVPEGLSEHEKQVRDAVYEVGPRGR